MDIVLKGLTWDHPRGYAPLVAGAVEYVRTHPGLEIHWDRRSLHDFGEAPIENLIEDYDLLIVDHPFVGFASAHEVLIDLAGRVRVSLGTRYGRKRSFPAARVQESARGRGTWVLKCSFLSFSLGQG